MADDSHNYGRRAVLRTIAAGSAVAVGSGLSMAGSAGPDENRLALVTEAERKYGDVESVERLFEAYGEPVVDALVANGYLTEGASVSVESVVSRHEFGNLHESGVAAVGDGGRDGEHVVDVRIRQLVEGYEIEYHLNPDVDDGYALVYPEGDGTASIVLSDGTEETIQSDYCCSDYCDDLVADCGDYRCTDDRCKCEYGYRYYYRDRYCCVTGDDACYCSWESSDSCSCPEYVELCPQSS